VVSKRRRERKIVAGASELITGISAVSLRFVIREERLKVVYTKLFPISSNNGFPLINEIIRDFE